MAKKHLIASQILYRDDGEYLPCCHICQETLDDDEWHCPYSHNTFAKKKCPADEFAIMLLDAKEEPVEINNVTRRFKVLKALLMDVEAAIPEESTLDKSKRDIKTTRAKWIERVKYATKLDELKLCLLQLEENLRRDWIRGWFQTDLWKAAVDACKTENELATLLYGFDRAILYNIPLKFKYQSNLDKKTPSCEEYPPKPKAPLTAAQAQAEFQKDPRLRINRLYTEAPPIFRKSSHVAMAEQGGNENGEKREGGEGSGNAMAVENGDSKSDKITEIQEHLLTLKRERSDTKPPRQPGQKRYRGIYLIRLDAENSVQETYEEEKMEDPDEDTDDAPEEEAESAPPALEKENEAAVEPKDEEKVEENKE
eukprot:CAMPEP_0167778296 /NCGR_PEP_ID=MMETSP0111_2-20121227/4173_1 /TAXON_ID=91324 /ORGANISM="Lotharella globosa, Strain CCCM811" /LENGTH=367 /DNA_ID=CAMNT_0007668581 /DNA_START=90 /DNA_END=1193 /DNA_ORIENTATION=-